MIALDAAAAIAELNAMLARMLDLQPALQVIGERQRAAIRDRITTGKIDPTGHAWSPWRPRTAAARAKKGNASQGLLFDSGTLLNSIEFVAGPAGVTIRTNDSSIGYASYLQDGTLRKDGSVQMVAREFMGWPDDLEPISQTVATYIETGVAL